ncbi:VWA domain-containing protein [Nordella sp. HKS 07]|uniref:vWA domain-containing protein n=1 Tax=Nordella sp. HKS 07 TaxID=2712222 RepID=UPI0013E16F9B|nr:vWA domain-containing protein [Nordella sp. HKS 07]QIG51775.1 VWA domain-containing protein [Nordella sp. HKS 07]
MHKASFSTWLKTGAALRRFRAGDKGSVAPIVALSAIPLVFIAGIAIDSSRQSTAQVEVQAATDAAALAGAAAYATGNNNYAAVANAYFDKSMTQTPYLAHLNLATDVSVDTANNTLTMTVSGNMPTTLTRIAGYEEMPIGTLSNAPVGGGGGGGDGGASAQTMAASTPGDAVISSTVSLPVFSDHHKGQIVLVMDYSSSMDEYIGGKRKYVTMRDEAAKLVDNLSQNQTNKDVEFGLVPFSHAVRVTMPNNFYYGKTGTTASTYCIDDRNYPYNLSADTPNTSTKENSTKFFTTSCSYFSSKNLNVRPLSLNHAGTVAQIKSMTPYGNTHIALGMETAWHLLTPNAPYAAPQNAEETLKAVVLLTDGQQTSPGNGPNNVLSVAQAETNLEEQCRRMKAAGIRVVTVSFDLSDQQTENRLKGCASENMDKEVAEGQPREKYYFDVDTNEQLATAFGIIRDSLARNMFLSK